MIRKTALQQAPYPRAMLHTFLAFVAVAALAGLILEPPYVPSFIGVGVFYGFFIALPASVPWYFLQRLTPPSLPVCCLFGLATALVFACMADWGTQFFILFSGLGPLGGGTYWLLEWRVQRRRLPHS